jgi:hypothetical protein
MLGTVRISQTEMLSAERLDNFSCEGERICFDEFPFVLDEDPPMMRRECRHDVLALQLPADVKFGAIELDAAVAVDLADERHQALGDGQSQVTAGIEVGLEREAVRQVPECRSEPIRRSSLTSTL